MSAHLQKITSSFDLSLDMPRELSKSRKVKYRNNFCGDVMLSKGNKPTFKNVVLKYRKSYHPVNASKGSRDMSC